MAIVRESFANASGSSTAPTFTKPATLNNGDVLVVVFGIRGPSTVTAVPAGWVEIDNNQQPLAVAYGYYKVITNAAGEPASYVWTISPTDNWAGGIVRYSGVDNATPEDVASANNGNPDAPPQPSVGGIITVTANAMIGAFIAIDATTAETITLTAGDAVSQVWDISSNIRNEFDDGIQASPGDTTSINWTLDLLPPPGRDWACILFALRPAGSEPPCAGFDEGFDSGFCKQSRSRTYAISALLRKTKTTTYLVAALLKKAQTRTYGVSALLRKTQARTYAVAALLRRTSARTYAVDARLLKTQARTYTVDARLKKAQTRGYSTSALLRKAQTRTYSISGSLKETQTRTHGVTALLRKTQTRTYAVEAFLVRRKASTYATAALLKKTRAITYAVDALLVVSGTHTVGYVVAAALQKTKTSTYQVQALLRITRTRACSISALLRKTFTKAYSVSALLSATRARTYVTSALLKKTSARSHSVDVLIVQSPVRRTVSHDVDAFLRATRLRSYSVGALLKRGQNRSYQVDARVAFPTNVVIYQTSAFLAKSFTFVEFGECLTLWDLLALIFSQPNESGFVLIEQLLAPSGYTASLSPLPPSGWVQPLEEPPAPSGFIA